MAWEDPDDFLREVFYLNHFRHPSIVMYKDSWIDNQKKKAGQLNIAMEYMNGGTLETNIKRLQGNPQSEDTIWKMAI